MTLPRTYEKEEIMTFFPFMPPIRGTKPILNLFRAISYNHSTQMLKSRRHGPMEVDYITKALKRYTGPEYSTYTHIIPIHVILTSFTP